MPLQGPENTVEERSSLWPDFVCVSARYRVGKLLGSGGSGESDSDSISTLL